MNDNNINTIDPLVGLCEMDNITTVCVDGYDAKIHTTADEVEKNLKHCEPHQKMYVITTDPAASKKIIYQLNQRLLLPRTKVGNLRTNMGKLSDLSDIGGIIIMDSGLFKNADKYLIATKAAGANCTLTMVL